MIQKKILIIEDDNLIIKILDFILKKEGYGYANEIRTKS